MHQHNLYISNSKLKIRQSVYDAIKTGLWFICFLICLDIGINFLFPYPSNPRKTAPGRLNRYFDYGRSIEGKISRQVGSTKEKSGLLAQVGWLNPQNWQERPTSPEKGKNLLVATYGMSFSNHVSHAMKAINPHISLRLIAGPAAPPNHSFAAYTLDRDNHKADVVILAILASSVKGLGAMSGMTLGPELPAPFTFPKYVVKDGKLKAIWPKIQSFAQLRIAINNKHKWREFVTQIQENDIFFNSFIFEENYLDSSALLRMIRRSIAQKNLQHTTNKIHTPQGFNQNWEGIAVLRLIVDNFATTARQDGKFPIVLLLNDRGYDDHLFQVLQPTLNNKSIPFVSTHSIVPATDMNNFISDGHFTERSNKLIAQEVLKLINKNKELIKSINILPHEIDGKAKFRRKNS